MALWEIGDKAVCVWKLPVNDGLEVGKVYHVEDIHDCASGLGLVLAELKVGPCIHCKNIHEAGWFADRFRKVAPDKHEAGKECQQLLDLFKHVREPVDVVHQYDNRHQRCRTPVQRWGGRFVKALPTGRPPTK